MLYYTQHLFAFMVRGPLKHLDHVFPTVPSNSDIGHALVALGNSLLLVFDEALLSGDGVDQWINWAPSNWQDGIMLIWSLLARCLVEVLVRVSLSNPQDSNCRAMARWSPFNHSWCNQSGTWSLPPFFFSHILRNLAFRAFSSLAELLR